MTLPHAQLEALARQLCEGRRGVGAYDRKGCKRAHWRKTAQRLHANVVANPVVAALWRACGWQI